MRENSRINQKRNGVKAPQNTILLASIVDRLGLLITALTGESVGEQVTNKFVESSGKEKQADLMKFNTVDDYLAARYGGII